MFKKQSKKLMPEAKDVRKRDNKEQRHCDSCGETWWFLCGCHLTCIRCCPTLVNEVAEKLTLIEDQLPPWPFQPPY